MIIQNSARPWRFIHRFERIEVQGRKALPCPTCGKRVRRQRTFGQTLNPFNKNKDGKIKTRAEIQAELRVEANFWQTNPEYCSRPCLDADS